MTRPSLASRLVAPVLAVLIGGASGAFAEAPPKLALEPVAEGFNAPVFLTAPDDGTGRRFLGEQRGSIHVIDRTGAVLPTPFLDLGDRVTPLLRGFDERGLWALAFHPRYAENGRFFITYSAPRRADSPFTGKTAHTWRLSEFSVTKSDANLADGASERVLLELDWVNRKHNGGGLAFGPDGFLYLGVGDGGGVHGVPDVWLPPAKGDGSPIMEDPFRIPEQFHHFDGYAQDTQRLQGKILRIDVDGAHGDDRPYAIPPTNLFRGKPEGRDEIYAWGFRNPFRLAFDAAGNGDLYVNGVAESFWETVYRVSGPGNYGWAVREGTHCFDRGRIFAPPKACPRFDALGERIQDPIVEYANQAVLRPASMVKVKPLGTASVGGYVYRGSAIPALEGRLVLGDFSVRFDKPSGQVLVATPAPRAGALWPVERALVLDVRVHSLGEDADGELYVLTTALGIPVGNTGKVFRLVTAEN